MSRGFAGLYGDARSQLDRFGVENPALQERLRLRRFDWMGVHGAENDAAFLDDVAVGEPDRGRDAEDREIDRAPTPQLAIGRLPARPIRHVDLCQDFLRALREVVDTVRAVQRAHGNAALAT